MSENSESSIQLVPMEPEITSMEEQTNEVTYRESAAIKRLRATKLPPDPSTLATVIKLLSDKNVRISKVSECILKDPICTMELLSVANSSAYSSEKTSVTAVPTAIIRIGSEELLTILNNLSNQIFDSDPLIVAELSSIREISQKSCEIAEILSSHLQRDIIETAQVCALFCHYDQMLAIGVLEDDYLEFSHLKKKSTLFYRLQSIYSYNAQKSFIEYLNIRGLPEEFLFAFDKELKCKTTAQSSLRFIVEAAEEMATAITNNKFERYRSLDNLPAKSSLRLLKISDYMYEIILEELDELFFSSNKQENDEVSTDAVVNLDESRQLEESLVTLPGDPSQELNQTVQFISHRSPTIVMDRSELVNYFTQSGAAVFIEKPEQAIAQELADLSEKAKLTISSIQDICASTDNIQEALSRTIESITSTGPFSRAAIIELSEGRKEAYIHRAFGEEFTGVARFERLEVKDALCPLSTFATKLQSFNSKNESNPTSPFGVSSYAISPLKGEFPSPIVLYADCGTERPIPLESRKVFRLVVAVLNEYLPTLGNKGKIESAFLNF